MHTHGDGLSGFTPFPKRRVGGFFTMCFGFCFFFLGFNVSRRAHRGGGGGEGVAVTELNFFYVQRLVPARAYLGLRRMYCGASLRIFSYNFFFFTHGMDSLTLFFFFSSIIARMN